MNDLESLLEDLKRVLGEEELKRVLTEELKPYKKSGFEPYTPSIPWKFCTDPGHYPPTHLFIPSGSRYRHVCPSCGNIQYIHSNDVYC